MPEDAEKVKHVYELFLSSGNLSMVGHTLLRENCTFRGKVPSWTFLRSMLNNRVYIGDITHKGTSFPGLHQPIIDKETFNKVNIEFNKVLFPTFGRPIIDTNPDLNFLFFIQFFFSNYIYFIFN